MQTFALNCGKKKKILSSNTETEDPTSNDVCHSDVQQGIASKKCE